MHGVLVFKTARNTMTDCNVNNNYGSGVFVYEGGRMIIDGYRNFYSKKSPNKKFKKKKKKKNTFHKKESTGRYSFSSTYDVYL